MTTSAQVVFQIIENSTKTFDLAISLSDGFVKAHPLSAQGPTGSQAIQDLDETLVAEFTSFPLILAFNGFYFPKDGLRFSIGKCSRQIESDIEGEPHGSIPVQERWADEWYVTRSSLGDSLQGIRGAAKCSGVVYPDNFPG